jgi:hypothetical protein
MTQRLPSTKTASSRRAFFSGAATVGVAAAVATAVPQLAPTSPAAVDALPPAPDNGGGYTLSEHVKRYYKTATV